MHGGCATLSVGILTARGREPYVERLLAQLDDPARYQTTVYHDEDLNGVWWNSRRAWTDLPDGLSHRLVLESDIVVCQDFLATVARIARLRPACYVNFFRSNKTMIDAYRAGQRWLPHVYAAGQATLVPATWVNEFWTWADALPKDDPAWTPARAPDRDDWACDVMWMAWLRRHRKEAVVTVPSLVWHVGRSISLWQARPGTSRWTEPRPQTFLGEDKSGLDLNWEG